LNYYNDLIDAPSPFYNYITYLGNFGKDISENSLIHYTNTIQNKLAEIQKNTTESGVLTAQLELQELLRNMSKQINQSIHDKIQNNINHSGSCFPEKKLIDQEDVGTQDLNNTK
jgi:S-adenosylmethionine synthetase